MAIEKMSLVHIVGGIDSLDDCLVRCCGSGIFHVEYPEVSAKMGFMPLRENNPYVDILQKIQEVMNDLRVEPVYRDSESLKMDEGELIAYLEHIKKEVTESKQHEKQLRGRLRNHKQALKQAKHLQGLDIRLSDIADSENSTARFGKLPADNFLKLSYFSNHNFFFFDFDHDEDYYWGFYVSPNSEIENVDRVFNSLYFEQIDVSEYAHETPQSAIEALEAQIEIEKSAIRRCEKEQNDIRDAQKRTLEKAYSRIKLMHDTFSYRRYATTSNNRFYLEGFVPARQAEAFSARFSDLDHVLCDTEEITKEMGIKPPVKLKTNRFFRPFEMFIDMYGLPGYYDFNPTSFIGFIYVVLFGMMYGDFGQGMGLIAAGFIMWKWMGMALGKILTRCGIASMFFGFLYGSFFGIEESFKPIFDAIGLGHIFPLHILDSDTSMTLLMVSLGIGIVIIIAAIITNIVIRFRKRDLGKALFSNNGIAGLVFYGGIVLAVLLLWMFEINVLNPIFITVVVALPLLAMFFQEPLTHWIQKRKRNGKESKHEKFSVADAVFEMIEILLSFGTNTLSFLRVGGFVLSHAALMMVVMSFTEMAGTVGGVAVMIAGNLFVMALEGLLVGIQVLRLVYYETFSRFYEAEGTPYRPVSIEYSEEKK